MRKIKLAAIITLFNASFAFAGGILTNTNQSIHFLRNPARDASMEIDAVYTNPAALIKLAPGFHFSINNQSAFQTRTITTTFDAYQYFGENKTKKFKGEASAPIVPSVMAVYRIGDWALSGSIAVTGGGGKATFDKGLPSFESAISMLVPGVNALGQALGAMMPGATLNVKNYSVDAYMRGSSFIYGAQLGGTYKINDMFSAYGGFRLNIVNNRYEGHLTDIRINPESNIPALGSGAMVPATAYFTGLIQNIPQLPQEYRRQLEELAETTKDKYLDNKQSGWGVAPILGVNFNYNNLNVGVKYEFRTNLNVENKIKIDNTGMFKEGVNTPHDIPALLTIGASYRIIPQLLVSAGYHHFFDKQAKMDADKQDFLKGGTDEYLAGIEFQINRLFLVSGGFQLTRYGVTDDYQKDLSFSLNSYSVGLGGAVNITPTVKINVGYFWTTYDDFKRESSNYVGTGQSGKDVFSRTNKVFGAGVDFSF